jgi:hypothetical protein
MWFGHGVIQNPGRLALSAGTDSNSESVTPVSAVLLRLA